tara:strand:+ start:373 stop:810 length:438 start_codon:yes stop_codon:yes gene_type:complete
MILALNIYDIDTSNLIISNKEINMVSDCKYFYKLFYSTSCYLMSGIYININFIDYKSSIFYNYIKINYNTEQNNGLINKVREMENYILSGISPNIKNNLYNDLLQGSIKIQTKNQYTNQKHIALKITGIWENYNVCGLCYKFLFI